MSIKVYKEIDIGPMLARDDLLELALFRGQKI